MELGPDLEELADSFGVEFSDEVVGPGGSFSVHVAETDLSWGLGINDVGFFVPAPLIIDE